MFAVQIKPQEGESSHSLEDHWRACVTRVPRLLLLWVIRPLGDSDSSRHKKLSVVYPTYSNALFSHNSERKLAFDLESDTFRISRVVKSPKLTQQGGSKHK